MGTDWYKEYGWARLGIKNTDGHGLAQTDIKNTDQHGGTWTWIDKEIFFCWRIMVEFKRGVGRELFSLLLIKFSFAGNIFGINLIFLNKAHKFGRKLAIKDSGGHMKKVVLLSLALSVLAMFLLAAGCSKKAGEKEYFDMAYQYMGKEKWSDAEKYFQKILDEYPNGVYSSKALFMVGFINANYLKNYDKAKKYYTEFLQKYPNHDLADDARYELENLGKNIDDLPFLKEGDSGDKGTEKPQPVTSK